MNILNTENRITKRSSIPLPVRVYVPEDNDETWTEETVLSDVSAMGGGFRLNRPVERGRLLQLTLKMPAPLRQFDLDAPDYCIWAISRRCVEVPMLRSDPYYMIGAAFIGQFRPTDHLHQPTALFEIVHDQPGQDGFWSVSRVHDPEESRAEDRKDDFIELRRHSRIEIPEEILLERIDESGRVWSSESTITTNISVGGASVFTQMSVEAGTILRVTSKRADITIISIVRSRVTGDDGLSRLHLEFIDKQFPLEGIV